MASLVADYSSTEDETDDDSDSDDVPSSISLSGPRDRPSSFVESTNTKNHDDSNSSDKLPLPDFATSSIASLTTSVFSNPFSEAERAKKAILEKHVKMTPTRDNIKMINGKKICWNFRKGRCRFGHTCKFAHDSDLHCKETLSGTEENDLVGDDNTLGIVNQILPVDEEFVNAVDADDDDALKQTNTRKRPGLSQGLIPGKKVMKMYKKQSKRPSVLLKDSR